MEVQLTQRGRKMTGLMELSIPLIFAIILYFVIFLISKKTLSLCISLAIGFLILSLIELLFYKLYKIRRQIEAWEYPQIVKIEDNKMRVLLYDVDKKRYEDRIKPIDFNSIYQIVIKDKSFQMYYYLDGGKKYLTGFALDGFFIRHIKKDREKILEILNEVLKRIDKEKVKIIDKRKRKNLKILGGDR